MNVRVLDTRLDFKLGLADAAGLALLAIAVVLSLLAFAWRRAP